MAAVYDAILVFMAIKHLKGDMPAKNAFIIVMLVILALRGVRQYSKPHFNTQIALLIEYF